MVFSLLQTLLCVLLFNSGLYALHLTGSNAPAANTPNNNNDQPHAPNPLNKPSANSFQATNNRLNEELADLAQLERERLMVMGLAKQTAEESGYRGHPIVTGRIKMHPPADMEPEYSAWLNQQQRKVMFGNIVKQVPNDEADYYAGGAAGAFEPLSSSNKYDYGHAVQTADREFENPHNLDLDDFVELQPVQDEEDVFPDMEGYAYIEELMAEENRERQQNRLQQQQRQHWPQHQHQHQQMLEFPGLGHNAAIAPQQQYRLPYGPHPYQNHEPLDTNQQALQDFFENEEKLQLLNHQQQQQQQQQQADEFNAKYRNNMHLQQKWLRKRNQRQQQQQQPPELLPRNIFGQKNSKQPHTKTQHHFNSHSSSKLPLVNSAPIDTSRINNNKQTESAQQFQTHELQLQHQQQPQQQQHPQQQQQPLHAEDDKQKVPSAALPTQLDKSLTSLEQNTESLQQTNHKRSSLGSVAGASSPHSLASQLMLRSVRGQRQYDVPQIECPTAIDGMERFACPTPDVQGRYRCIDDHALCDGFIDCPEGEDEDRRSCMFFKTTKAHLDVLADALLRWARGR